MTLKASSQFGLFNVNSVLFERDQQSEWLTSSLSLSAASYVGVVPCGTTALPSFQRRAVRPAFESRVSQGGKRIVTSIALQRQPLPSLGRITHRAKPRRGSPGKATLKSLACLDTHKEGGAGAKSARGFRAGL